MRYRATYIDDCENVRDVDITADTESEAVTILEWIATACGFIAVGVVA